MTTIYPMDHKICESVTAYTCYEFNYKNLKDSFYNGMSAMLLDARARLDYLRYTVALMHKELEINGEYVEDADREDLENAIWNAEQMIISLEDFVKTMEALS